MANLVDDLIAEACRDWTIEKVLDSVNRYNRVVVMTAVEGNVPERRLMADGEVNAGVPHFSDIDDRRTGDAGRGWDCRIEQQVVRVASVHVHDQVDRPVEEGHVRAHVSGPVFFPLEIGVSQSRLPVSRGDRAARARYVVEGLSRITAEQRADTSRRNELVSRDADSISEHDIREESVSGEERLIGESPSQSECREGSPLVAWCQSRGAV